jgi:ribose-phosphate pyrophosphokinase
MIYINGSPVNTTLFPDNTSQVWHVATLDIPSTNYVHVCWEFSHEGEFMQLAQLKSLIDAKGFSSSLRLPYLPYGRQDKEVGNNATFALYPFADLLNSLAFDEVIIHDPHSHIALGLILNSRAVYPIQDVMSRVQELSTDLIAYPDKGALTKYSKKYEFPYVYGEKVRDQATGNILSYELIGTGVYNKNILICDDLIDGGATFVLLAKELYSAGAKEVNLFATHGIFSKGLRPLLDAGIKRIFTEKGEVSEHQNYITYKE